MERQSENFAKSNYDGSGGNRGGRATGLETARMRAIKLRRHANFVGNLRTILNLSVRKRPVND